MGGGSGWPRVTLGHRVLRVLWHWQDRGKWMVKAKGTVSNRKVGAAVGTKRTSAVPI